MKKIVFTGGGSAGHVTPNVALIKHLLWEKWEIHYIGTKNGIEKDIISKIPGVTYHEINAGKLRRYKSIENLKDPFRVIHGIGQSVSLIREIKPDIVFSKGGFVSVPVVIGAWMNRIPAVIHECDYTPGLANKLVIPFAKRVCVTFPDTLKGKNSSKQIHTGTPIRKELFDGDKSKGLQICGFKENKPVIMMMGGSLGAVSINKCLRNILDRLLTDFNVVHLCGKGNMDEKISHEGYRQFEYLGDELPHVLAASDVVISRAGANSIFEFLALCKPCLLIPLPLSASRGDQILNAAYFEKCGYSKVLKQEDMNETSLYNGIFELYHNRNKYISNMKKASGKDSTNELIKIIKENAKSK